MRARPAVVGARRPAAARTGARATFTLPEAGRIVAVGGHLHGGALSLELSQPACDDRTLVRSKPAYAPKDDPLYAVTPLLHEPDPKGISWWQSATGWPIRAGEKLKVTAAYDGSRPHTRVMGIDHVYIAPPGAPAPRCAPAPRDAEILGPGFDGARWQPPNVALTLARLGKDGLARPSTSGMGDPRAVAGDAKVTVDGYAFRPDHLEVTRRRDRALAVRRARRQARRHARRRPGRLRLAVAVGRRPLRAPLHRARHVPAAVLAARGVHVAGGARHAVTTAPPRRGSPPPLNSRVSWWRSTAWQPPKNRLRSRNQASERPAASSAWPSIPGSA